MLQSARAFGPMLAVVLFVVLGDHWRVEELRLVITGGILLACIAAVFLLFAFNDDNALGAQSEAHHGRGDKRSKGKKKRGVGTVVSPSFLAKKSKRSGGGSSWWRKKDKQLSPMASHYYEDADSDDSLLGDPKDSPDDSSITHPKHSTPTGIPDRPLRRHGNTSTTTGNTGGGGCGGIYEGDNDADDYSGDDDSSSSSTSSNGGGGTGRGGKKQRQCCSDHSVLVPTLLAISSAITGIASGMTVKFFPIFFMNEVELNPVATNCIFAATPLAVAAFSMLSKRVAERLGNIGVAVLFKLCGISLLVTMAAARSLWVRPEAIIPIYMLRTALMNSTTPLLKAVRMDFVAKENRAKWSSLDALTRVGWSGSAALGGWILDTYGWGMTFEATSALQFLALVPLFPLLWIVPIKM